MNRSDMAGDFAGWADFVQGQVAILRIAPSGYNPDMETVTFSEAALSLLRRRMADEWVGVTEENRPHYRELVAAGLMYPLHTFLGGNEGYYRPTEAALDFIAPPSRVPGPSGSLARRD